MANSDATPQNVADMATNQIDLPNEAMLIGTFGPEADAQALLRLPSGRIRRVERGDRVDGLRITAIAPGQLHAIRRGQAVTLTMPGE